MSARAQRWRTAALHRAPRTVDPAGLGRLVVVAAHPDDETLAAAGLLRAAHAAGGHVELVVATDGEAALPELTAIDRAALGRTRRVELRTALDRLGLGATPITWLGMPDSALDEGELAAALVPHLAGADAYLAPWEHDPHPDHAAAGRAAAAAAPVTTHGWGYPIWAVTATDPDDPSIPWSRAYTHVLDERDRDAKRHAIAAFTSQTEPMVTGGRAVLPAEVLEHFRGDVETFFRAPPSGSAPADRFDELYRDGADPWDTRDSFYERRKRAVLLACLPRARYRHAAEPGCGLGELTRELALRCDRVSASDDAGTAVRAAATATTGAAGVQVGRRRLPDDDAVPRGVDLVVLSEVLYYLADADAAAVVDRVAAALERGGDLVVAHWRGWPAEAPADAATVHRRLCDDPRFAVLVAHTDEQFLLHVLRRR